MHQLTVRTSRREEMMDITHQIQELILRDSVSEGTCTIYIPHTTAGITINENADPSVQHDILLGLARAFPDIHEFNHSEGNAAAHIKASIMGSSQTVLIKNGRLALGTWQGIYLCEFDGPRSREIFIEFVKRR